MKYSMILLATMYLSLGSFCFGADTHWRTYSLKGFPRSAEGCIETAQNLGQKFSQITGQAVFRSLCEEESIQGYDIVISYVAPNPVGLVSTLNESGGLGSLGLFGTFDECLKALPREIDTFTKATGLDPFVSYCFKESSLNLTPYVARIDAWGDAKLYPYRFQGSLFASQIDRASEVISAVWESSKSAGVPVYHVSLAHDGNLKLVVRFYGSVADKNLHSGYFNMSEVSRYSSLGTRNPLEICRKELAEVSKSYSSKFSTKGIFFCAWDKSLFEAKLYLLRIRRTEGIKTDTPPVRYPTFGDCDRERPAIQDWYKKALGMTPFAIVCTWKSGLGTGKSDAFVMRVLTKTSFEEELPYWPDPDLGSASPFRINGGAHD